MIEEQVFARDGSFRAHADTLHLESTCAPEFIDITDRVALVVAESGVSDGLVSIFSQHTTAAVKINESEPELHKDMAHFLSEIAPLDREYHHNNFGIRTVNMEDDESPNAHAHCQHIMLSASETVPVLGGRMQLGRWQRVFLVELDRPKRRRVTVQVLGI